MDGGVGNNEAGVNVQAELIDRQPRRTSRERINVGHVERWGSMAAGAALAAYGLSRRRGSGLALAALGAFLIRRGATGHCDVYQALGLSSVPGSDTRRALGGPAGVHVDETVVIDRPASELFRYWRNLENLPRVMTHLSSVERVTDTLSRWRADGPAGTTLEWNAEIINEVPDRLIGWRSIEGSDVVSAGSVHFDERRGRQTRVRVRLQYSPPAGKVGDAIARLTGRDAATQIREDLRRFKDEAESVGGLR
ncbi:MAG TPA: SRPBCC family protein [Vicinamibacterales bacterium]|nr:SRPBCC family protein [Vicinamibacterales bacterium]